MFPLRFVAVCKAGHIEDFPWNAWAHSERGKDLNAVVGDGSAVIEATTFSGDVVLRKR